MSNDWWSKKLNTQPVAQPKPVLQQPQPQYQPAPEPQYPPSQGIQMTPRCPGCGSSNYVGADNTRPRCYDCGYPIQQSGSGVGTGIVGSTPRADGPVQAAKQVESGGWNPQGIIGKLG
jgi:hypothetical protein